MRYGIVINMDYDTHPYEVSNRLFEEIRDGLLRHGFRQDGRTFTIELPAAEACALARRVVDDVAAYEQYHHKDIYNYMKEFYGFEMARVVNLLVPGNEISVTELEGMQVEDLLPQQNKGGNR